MKTAICDDTLVNPSPMAGNQLQGRPYIISDDPNAYPSPIQPPESLDDLERWFREMRNALYACSRKLAPLITAKELSDTLYRRIAEEG